MRRVLFVCSANLDRSPTAEQLFSGWKDKWETKSAGITTSPDKHPVTQALIDWADLILVMELRHAQHIQTHFKCNPNKIHNLDIVNKYVRNDPELIRELENKVRPILDLEDSLLEIWEKAHR